ncbi:MAG: sigma 54-interacting transcriptional regulator [Sandaracinus sp.]|nr:sigma 54-interacting transcriptional regulator [Sandaracinus sp.]MCB9630722.1 sigma 54-interacting transcriptional regulator [Sandaracinus sp.]
MSHDDATRTLDDAKEPTSRPQVVLVGVHGPARTSPHLPLRREVVVGRGADCGLRLDDDSVSRHHASFAPTRGGVSVKDLASRNGVFVDGERLDGARFVPFGACVRVGRSLFVAAEESPSSEREPSFGLVGGASLAPLRRRIRQLASTTLSVWIRGETGSGKELVARALHEASGRTGELVSVNCAAIPESLVDSELFGHVRGAYSGAERARDGLVVRAHRGTLFLDELGDLPLAMQAKLLRVLEDGVVRALGRDEGRAVDVRVVAATHHDLRRLAADGAFRADLLYRLAAAEIEVPPLRARREDLPELIEHFVAEGPKPDLGAMEALFGHRWPGNVRELRNVVLAASAMAHEEGLEAFEGRHLPPLATADAPARDELRVRIEEALRAHAGNVSAAAKALGMRRPGLYESMVRLGIDPARHRPSRRS